MSLSQNKKIQLLHKVQMLLTSEERDDPMIAIKLMWLGVGLDIAACESMVNEKFIRTLLGLKIKDETNG